MTTSEHTIGPTRDHVCDHNKPHPYTTMFMKVTAIALGAFAAYVEWKLFVASILVGIPLGFFWAIKGHHCPQASCSGVIDNLTQTQLPPVINVIFGAAITICHLDHHPTVFVPLVGLSLGAWVGTFAQHS